MGSKKRTTIFVTTSFDGVHNYPNAPDKVSFLRENHRHKFGIRVELEVFHDDREVEFFILKNRITNWLSENMDGNEVWLMGSLSCEQVANMLIEELSRLKMLHGERLVRVTIDEDGQNGAIVKTKIHKGFNEVHCNNNNDVPIVKNGYFDFYDSDDCFDDEMCDECDCNCNDTFDEYQQEAYSQIQEHIDVKEEIMHWAIGLGEESGEVLGVIKHKYYGGQYMVEDLVEELGDVLWYVAALCTVNNIDLSDVIEYNMAKLKFRYPNVDFDCTRSMARADIKKEFRNNAKHNEIMTRILKKINTRVEMLENT